jgi:hypothetical protein
MRKALSLVVSILLVVLIVSPASAGQRSARPKSSLSVCTTAEGVLICGVAAGVVGSCLYDGANCAAKARSATCTLAESIAPVREKTIEFAVGVMFPNTVKRTSSSSCSMVGGGGRTSYGVALK